MKRATYMIPAAALFYCGLAMTSPASAEELPVRNAGFEADVLADPGSQGKTWQFEMRDWTGYRHGIMRPGPEHFPDGLPVEGRNVAFLSFGASWMAQELDAELQPETAYELQVLAGARGDGDFAKGGEYRMQLFAGDELLAEKTAHTAPGGELVQDVLAYTSGAEVAGGQLKIKLINLGARQVNFDNVVLSVPETEDGDPEAEEELPADPEDETEEAPEWETVGLWTYDEADGMYLGDGLVLFDNPGSGIGHSWQNQLELTSHADLPPRERMLWPVSLNRRTKQVCVNSPYPSFRAHVDVPGEAYDGIYSFGTCQGGFEE